MSPKTKIPSIVSSSVFAEITLVKLLLPNDFRSLFSLSLSTKSINSKTSDGLARSSDSSESST